AVLEDFEMGVDDVGDIAKEQRGALLAFVLDVEADVGALGAGHDGAAGGRHFAADFVATNGGEADGIEDVDAVDDPADLRFPVDRFENAASGGGRDDVVGDALGLHFGAGKAGEIAPDVELDTVGHGLADGEG